MVMIMSTYRYNYLRAPNYPSTVRNNLRGPASVAARRLAPFSPDELVETSLRETSSETNDLSSAYLYDIVTKLVYVLQI